MPCAWRGSGASQRPDWSSTPDRGSQYCGNELQDALKSYGMKSSMSREGNCWDNAPTQSLWGRLKVGRLYGKTFATQRDAMDEIIDWLTFYNHRSLHSTLGYVSPMRFEKTWHSTQQDKAAQSSGYGVRTTAARSHLPDVRCWHRACQAPRTLAKVQALLRRHLHAARPAAPSLAARQRDCSHR